MHITRLCLAASVLLATRPAPGTAQRVQEKSIAIGQAITDTLAPSSSPAFARSNRYALRDSALAGRKLVIHVVATFPSPIVNGLAFSDRRRRVVRQLVPEAGSPDRLELEYPAEPDAFLYVVVSSLNPTAAGSYVVDVRPVEGSTVLAGGNVRAGPLDSQAAIAEQVPLDTSMAGLSQGQLGYVNAMKRSLSNLLAAQGQFFGSRNSYSEQLEGLRRLWRPLGGVSVELSSVTQSGWSATARNPGTPVVCAVRMGSAPNPLPIPVIAEGEVKCARPGGAAPARHSEERSVAAPPPARLDTSTAGLARSERAYLAMMKSDLRNLVTVQDWFFVTHATYSADLSSLQFPPSYPFALSNDVTVEFISVSNNGWSAGARHPSTPFTCVIFVGGAPPPFDLVYEAEPKCGRVVGASPGTQEARSVGGGVRNLATLPSRYSGSIARGESLRFSITLTASTAGCNASTGTCSIVINASATVPYSISLHNARGQLVDRGRVYVSGESHDAEIAAIRIPIGSYELIVTGLARGWITVSWS